MRYSPVTLSLIHILNVAVRSGHAVIRVGSAGRILGYKDVIAADNVLSVPNAAITRGNYVLVTKDSPSAANADDSMTAPDGYVYVKVETGVSDDDYIAITSGLTAEDTVAYDSSYSTTTLAGDVQLVMDGGDMGGGPGGAPGGGGPGGGQ